MVLTLRPADAANDEAAEELSRRAFQALRAVYRPREAETTRKAEKDSRYCRLVAEHQGRVVATVEYRLEETALHIRGLAVDPAFQGRGFARRVVEELAGIARARGRRSLTLYTIRETGNVALFERLGFRVVGEEVASWCESDRFDKLHEDRMERPVA
jgi:ribosomal protein S18 acetylase RimI-like enzyme